jgi:hypothetical protein
MLPIFQQTHTSKKKLHSCLYILMSFIPRIFIPTSTAYCFAELCTHTRATLKRTGKSFFPYLIITLNLQMFTATSEKFSKKLICQARSSNYNMHQTAGHTTTSIDLISLVWVISTQGVNNCNIEYLNFELVY